MRAKAPFIVPVAGVTQGNKEFSFLSSMHNLNCCGEPSGVCFVTTTIGLAHGDMLLWILPASSNFYLLFQEVVMLKG